MLLRSKGQPYDAHHIMESSYGGPCEWYNLHPPCFPDQEINKDRRRKKVAFRKSHDSSCKIEQRRSPEASRFEKINLERKICVLFGCVEEIGGNNRLEMRRYFCSEQGSVFPSGKIGVITSGFIANRRVLRYCFDSLAW